jgi:putative transposase
MQQCHGIRSILTPFRAPRANAFAERWARTVRRECLDWTLVLGRRHLERALSEYIAHYNAKRPHRGIELQMPDAPSESGAQPPDILRVRRNDVLGGLIHEYELVA